LGELSSADLPYENWSPQATVYFLKSLPPELSTEQLQELDASLQLSQSGNAEIAKAWFIQVAQRRYQAAYPEMKLHLERSCRTWLIKPVYQALVENGEDAALAEAVFLEAQDNYHPLTAAAIQRLFEMN
jgi:hypothetical protein